MVKKLKSGVELHDNIYYALLEWKDKNMNYFLEECSKHSLPISINQMNLKQINLIITIKDNHSLKNIG